MIFLIFYYNVNKVRDKDGLFLKLCGYGILHVILDIITVITVNNRDIVPDTINKLLHIAFYSVSVLFTIVFLHYILNISSMYKYSNIIKNISYLPFYIYLFMCAVLPVKYTDGISTDYSDGILVYLGFGLFVAYCLIGLIILIAVRDSVDNNVKYALIPMIIAMSLMIITQAIVPELLLTSAAVTFICLGLFISLDNPDKDLKKQALWDYATGLKNKNSYTRDIENYEDMAYRKKYRSFAVVIADMNYLKLVNDCYGHIEGDNMIKAAADALRNGLKSAANIYRLGGDEFIAIYMDTSEERIKKEIANVTKSCRESTGLPVSLSIAIGYSIRTNGEELKEMINRADHEMYKQKNIMKTEKHII